MTHTPTPTAAKKAAPKKNSNDLVANNPFVEFVKLYKNNPVLFVREVLNTEPDQWQVEFLNSIAQGNRGIYTYILLYIVNMRSRGPSPLS